MAERMLLIAVELSEIQAEALAQFVKRVGFSEIRQNAVDDAEACTIRRAVDQLTKALREAGYAPR